MLLARSGTSAIGVITGSRAIVHPFDCNGKGVNELFWLGIRSTA
jgi:hypothetical protein